MSHDKRIQATLGVPALTSKTRVSTALWMSMVLAMPALASPPVDAHDRAPPLTVAAAATTVDSGIGAAQPTAQYSPAKKSASAGDVGIAMQDMDHSKMQGMDQGKAKAMPMSEDKPQDDMQGMEMGPMQGGSAPPDAREPDTYADGLRSGPMPGMDMPDDELYGRLLLDKLEYVDAKRGATLRLDGQAWFGGDRNKLWLKADGERTNGRLGATRTEALWSRTFATYWSSELGVRHDFGEGPGRSWVAAGVQGIAPYWFDVEATAYVGESGRTAARLELEYDLLLTQRLILQPDVELNVYGKDDRARGLGAGLANLDLGLRLRYEISRQFAPYVGVVWTRKFAKTADFARTAGESVQDTQFVAGVRIWF